MKKNIAIMLSLVLIFAACSSNDDDITTEPATTEAPQQITFRLTASHPDDNATAQTRAVKAGWEDGDAIFVFFTGAAAPKHLKMTFDGSAWTSAEYNGATKTDGALGLKNGDSGTMRAVYLPFGSDATVVADGTSFKFSTDYYAYYETATLAYTVTDNEVNGAFSMTIPADYVQFFVEDAAASDGDYNLGTDAVIPTGVASIAADGTITETSDKFAGDDMPGYAYSGGYLFSGVLNPDYAYSGNYYFAKTKTADGTRADYFVTGKTLASHSAVKLPANSSVYSASNTSGKWIPVGSGVTVPLFNVTGTPPTQNSTSLGTWQTCNYGQTAPEALGSLYTFDAANALGVTLPTKDNFVTLITDCTITWLTVRGQPGAVVKASRGFLFLPAQNGSNGYYWSSTGCDSEFAWLFFFHSSVGHFMTNFIRTGESAVRPIVN